MNALWLVLVVVVVGIGTVVEAQVVRCLTTNSSLTGEINEIVVQMDGEVTFNGSAKLLAAGFSVKLNGYRPLLVKNAVVSSTNITLELYTGPHAPDPQTGYKPNLTYTAPPYTYKLTVGGVVYNSFTCDGVMEDHARPRLIKARIINSLDTGGSFGWMLMIFSEPVIRCPSVSSDPRLYYTSSVVATFGNGDGWFPNAPASSDSSLMVWGFHSPSAYETMTTSGTVTVIGDQVCEANNTGLSVDHTTRATDIPSSADTFTDLGIRWSVCHDTDGDGLIDMIKIAVSWPQRATTYLSQRGAAFYGATALGISRFEIERLSESHAHNVYIMHLNTTRMTTTTDSPYGTLTARVTANQGYDDLSLVYPTGFDGITTNVAASSARTCTDLARPTIASAFLLLTNDTHGYIDITISETTSFGSSPSVSDFFLLSHWGSQIVAVTPGFNVQQMRLNVSMTYKALSGQQHPDRLSLSLDVTQATSGTATGIPDVSAYFSNMLLVSNDTVAPWIASAYTFDTDANGRIDLISISYSESMYTPQLNISIVYPILSISLSSTGQQSNFTLDEGSVADTATTILLVYPSTPVDINGNVLLNLSVSTVDRAPPVLLSASSADDLTLDITFSEVVSISSMTGLFGTSGSATLGDCTLDGSVVTCSITGTIDYETDVITVSSTAAVRDAAGNAMVYKEGQNVVLTVAEEGGGLTRTTTDDGWGAVEIGVAVGLGVVCLVLVGFLVQPYFGTRGGFMKLRQ